MMLIRSLFPSLLIGGLFVLTTHGFSAPNAVPSKNDLTPPSAADGNLKTFTSGEVVFETSFGQVVFQLEDTVAQETSKNFRRLVADGFYNHLCFHRIIADYVIQGGDPYSRFSDKQNYGLGSPGYTIPPEIRLKCTRGALVMARLPDPVNPRRDSNGSQFFICLQDTPELDGTYTVFGHVKSGLDILDKISHLPTDDRGVPTNRVEIKATLQNRGN